MNSNCPIRPHSLNTPFHSTAYTSYHNFHKQHHIPRVANVHKQLTMPFSIPYIIAVTCTAICFAAVALRTCNFDSEVTNHLIVIFMSFGLLLFMTLSSLAVLDLQSVVDAVNWEDDVVLLEGGEQDWERTV
jgi:hypothetical protein